MTNTQAQPHILINPSAIAAADRSFAYGDGAFTTMYAQQGTIALLPAHIARLQKSCDLLSLAFDDWLLLQNELAKLSRDITEQAIIKVLISRGSGGRGYQPPLHQQAICVISTHLASSMLQNKVIECVELSEFVLPTQPHLHGIKHNNRLPQVIAKQQAMIRACDDVLMCNEFAQVIEASSANIFYQLDGCWYTPPAQNSGVDGVMRNAFIAYLRASNIAIIEATHHVSQFEHINALLFSNAAKGIQIVKTLRLMNKSIHLELDWQELTHPFMHSLFESGSDSIV